MMRLLFAEDGRTLLPFLARLGIAQDTGNFNYGNIIDENTDFSPLLLYDPFLTPLVGRGVLFKIFKILAID
jgi:hypothetical protein